MVIKSVNCNCVIEGYYLFKFLGTMCCHNNIPYYGEVAVLLLYKFYRLNSLLQFNRLCFWQVTKTTREKCSGFAVLPPSVFFSIPYWSWKLFFNESQSDEVLKKVEGSYGVHVWNKMSSDEKIIVGWKQAYGLLAEKYCPRVYWNVDRCSDVSLSGCVVTDTALLKFRVL